MALKAIRLFFKNRFDESNRYKIESVSSVQTDARRGAQSVDCLLQRSTDNRRRTLFYKNHLLHVGKLIRPHAIEVDAAGDGSAAFVPPAPIRGIETGFHIFIQ